METTLILASSAFVIGVLAAKIRRDSIGLQNMQTQVAYLRQSMAGMLDTVRDVQQTNHQLLAEVSERDATIATMQAEHERSNLAIVNLIKSLNASNVRCSEMQQCMHVVGVEPQPGYFLATLADGTIAGPFGRN